MKPRPNPPWDPAEKSAASSSDDVDADPVSARRADRYIVYDDPDSGMQALEDDRDWHHDRLSHNDQLVCPECNARLPAPDVEH